MYVCVCACVCVVMRVCVHLSVCVHVCARALSAYSCLYSCLCLPQGPAGHNGLLGKQGNKGEQVSRTLIAGIGLLNRFVLHKKSPCDWPVCEHPPSLQWFDTVQTSMRAQRFVWYPSNHPRPQEHAELLSRAAICCCCYCCCCFCCRGCG